MVWELALGLGWVEVGLALERVLGQDRQGPVLVLVPVQLHPVQVVAGQVGQDQKQALQLGPGLDLGLDQAMVPTVVLAMAEAKAPVIQYTKSVDIEFGKIRKLQLSK